MEPLERLGRHLNEYYGNNKFTAKTKDWELFFSIECSSKGQAQKVERHIKRMKSKVYLKNIRKYPDISIKLLEKYKYPS